MSSMVTEAFKNEVVTFVRANSRATSEQVFAHLLPKGYKLTSVNHMSKYLRAMCTEGLLYAEILEGRHTKAIYSAPKIYTTKHENGITWGMEHLLLAEVA